MIDPVELTRDLIRCPSVTPEEGGALDLLQSKLEGLGFRVERVTFSEDGTPDVENLYARLGTGSPNFCFAGHTDVVPVGDEAAWSSDPFAAELRDEFVDVRGVVAREVEREARGGDVRARDVAWTRMWRGARR